MQRPHMYIRIHMCVCVYVYIYTYIHTYICMYVCMYVHTYMHMYVCIYVYSTQLTCFISTQVQILTRRRRRTRKTAKMATGASGVFFSTQFTCFTLYKSTNTDEQVATRASDFCFLCFLSGEYSGYLLYQYKSTNPGETDVHILTRRWRRARVARRVWRVLFGAKFTWFTGTKVQILTSSVGCTAILCTSTTTSFFLVLILLA